MGGLRRPCFLSIRRLIYNAQVSLLKVGFALLMESYRSCLARAFVAARASLPLPEARLARVRIHLSPSTPDESGPAAGGGVSSDALSTRSISWNS